MQYAEELNFGPDIKYEFTKRTRNDKATIKFSCLQYFDLIVLVIIFVDRIEHEWIVVVENELFRIIVLISIINPAKFIEATSFMPGSINPIS